MLLKRKHYVALVAVILVAVLAGSLYLHARPLTVNENGVNVEVGIVSPEGVMTPFRMGEVFSTVKVNGQYPDVNSYFYYKFTLNLKASGDISNAKVTAIHYSYTQKMNGVLGSWEAGTENPFDRPQTSPTETWLTVNLPVNTNVNIPLKYRDNYHDSEPTVMRPLSVKDVTAGNAIRDARLEKVGDYTGLAPGTYNLEYICTVHSVTWQYTNIAGQVVTEEYIPSPATLSATIAIQVYTDGTLTGSLVGTGGSA